MAESERRRLTAVGGMIAAFESDLVLVSKLPRVKDGLNLSINRCNVSFFFFTIAVDQTEPGLSEHPQHIGPAPSALTTFASLWATATIIHLISFQFWARTWQGWLLVLCTGLVLMRPASVGRFSAMVVASLLNLGRSLPFVPNHILFEGIINLTILIVILWNGWKSRSEIGRTYLGRHLGRELLVLGSLLSAYLLTLAFAEYEHLGGALTVAMMIFFSRRSAETRLPENLGMDIYSQIAAVLRWEVAAMYVWAVIQKLNADYFDPSVSCALKLQSELELMLSLPDLSGRLGAFISGASLGIEFLIPVCLLIPHLRKVGFALAIAFHLFLALHPFAGIYSFSALILAALSLFLPELRRVRLQQLWLRQSRWLFGRYSITAHPEFPGQVAIGVLYVFGITASVFYSRFGETRPTFQMVNQIGMVIFLTWGVWLGSSYLWSWRGSVEAPDRSLPGTFITPAWAGLVLVMLNGICPWVGLKTQTSFAMFSNLRTEFEQNHLFLRRINLFDYQSEMIEIVASEPDLLRPVENPTGIEAFANPGQIMPLFELRRLLGRADGDVTVTIIREGEEQTFVRKAKVDTFPPEFSPPAWWERKLLWFRRHENWTGGMPCTH